jgi:hypothetical protein
MKMAETSHRKQKETTKRRTNTITFRLDKQNRQCMHAVTPKQAKIGRRLRDENKMECGDDPATKRTSAHANAKPQKCRWIRIMGHTPAGPRPPSRHTRKSNEKVSKYERARHSRMVRLAFKQQSKDTQNKNMGH